MKRNLAITISFLFHPMLISLVVFAVLIFSNPLTSTNSFKILAICFIFSNLIPITTVFVFKKIGWIDDLDASIKDQRQFPLLLGIGYAGLGFGFLYLNGANALTQGLMFCYMTNTILTILINRYWKISIHSMGVSGPAAALWANGCQFPIIMGLIIFGVSYSRVILKAHTPSQVGAGAFLGFGSTFLQLNWFFV